MGTPFVAYCCYSLFLVQGMTPTKAAVAGIRAIVVSCIKERLSVKMFLTHWNGAGGMASPK